MQFSMLAYTSLLWGSLKYQLNTTWLKITGIPNTFYGRFQKNQYARLKINFQFLLLGFFSTVDFETMQIVIEYKSDSLT